MATRRTQEEINEEIARLKAIRDHVRHYTAFGDDNRAAIDAQIMVFERNLSTDFIYDIWDDDDYQLDNADWAANWRDGYEDDAPSANWVELTPEGNIEAYYSVME